MDGKESSQVPGFPKNKVFSRKQEARAWSSAGVCRPQGWAAKLPRGVFASVSAPDTVVRVLVEFNLLKGLIEFATGFSLNAHVVL